MSKFWQGLGSGMVESFFKRRPPGWLFAAPWVWPRRTYLVTEEQKATLIGPLRRMWRTQTLMGIVVAIGMLMFLQERPALTQAIVLGSVVVGIFILSSVYATLMIRPLLVGIPATNERISFSEKFKARAVALPKAFLIVGAVFSLVLFAGGLFVVLLGKWDLPGILSTVFFGALTLLYIAFFFARQAANR